MYQDIHNNSYVVSFGIVIKLGIVIKHRMTNCLCLELVPTELIKPVCCNGLPREKTFRLAVIHSNGIDACLLVQKDRKTDLSYLEVDSICVVHL